MEPLTRKLAQKYKRAQEESCKWTALHTRLLSLFSNAAAILQRLPVSSLLHDRDDLDKVWKALERIWIDACQILKAEKPQPTTEQAQRRYGLTPSLNKCFQGLEALYVMHRDEYRLKLSIVSALSYNLRPSDVVALQTLLVDQPNIPSYEVKFIFDTFYAGESS